MGEVVSLEAFRAVRSPASVKRAQMSISDTYELDASLTVVVSLLKDVSKEAALSSRSWEQARKLLDTGKGPAEQDAPLASRRVREYLEILSNHGIRP